MSAGDVRIIGWRSTVGDYYKELSPSVNLYNAPPGRSDTYADAVRMTRTIERRIICSDQYINQALSAIGTHGASMTLPYIDANGAIATQTLYGYWEAFAVVPAKYATGMTLLTIRCRMKVVRAFTFDLPALLTIEADESDVSKVHLKYNDTIIKTWDGGEDGTGLDIIGGDHWDARSEALVLRLMCNGVEVESYMLDKADFPTSKGPTTRKKVYGPVETALTTEEIEVLAAKHGVTADKITVQQSSVSRTIGDESPDIVIFNSPVPSSQPPAREPVYPLNADGTAKPAGETNPRPPIEDDNVPSITLPSPRARGYTTEAVTMYTYYVTQTYFYTDVGAAMTQIRNAGGLHWNKTGTTLKLLFGSFVWMQFDTTGLEPV